MKIVDTQFHIEPGEVTEIIAGMNALGINKAIVDEWWLSKRDGSPYVPLSTGSIRPVAPTAQLMSLLYPDRVGYVLRIELGDPEFASTLRRMKDDPGCKALRLTPGLSPLTIGAFLQGAYDGILAEACNLGLPVFIYLPDLPEAIAETAKRFPMLKICIDHGGLVDNLSRQNVQKNKPLSNNEIMEMYERVLKLSDFENIVYKWSHYSENFDIPAYPGKDLQPLLRKAINAFGAERIMWASDWSVNQHGETWGDMLYCIKSSENLTEMEKAAILGETACQWIGWE